MKIVEKEKARRLRKGGKSINQIVRETGYSKASISFWVRDIVLTKKQRQGLSERGRSIESIERRRFSRLANEQKKTEAIMNSAKQDITDISIQDLKLIGMILYWGEGGKTKRGMVRLANSDPSVIKIMMRFFREVCKVPELKFRGHIHTFDNADLEQTEKYWSGITDIPRNQFYKTYAKQSIASLQKRKTLPYGTFDICICDTKLFLTIMGWIEKVKELTISD